MELISNWFGLLVNRFTSFINVFKSVFGAIGDFFSGIAGIISGLWFGLQTLFNGVWDTIVEVLEGGVFANLMQAYQTISYYIGGPATIFISTMLFIIIVRIGISFVFKMFRLNVDYHALQSRSHTIATRDEYNAQLEKQRLFKDVS